MKKIKTYLKYTLFTILSILICLLLISTLYYFNIIGSGLVKYLRLLIIFINIFISSYTLGKHSNKLGYLEGLKLGGLLVFIFLLVSIIFFRNYFQLRLIFYDFILIFISVFGSMLGISKNEKK